MESESADRSRAAADALDALADDRTRLAARTRAPRALLLALGAVAAWWVADAARTTPGADHRPPVGAGLLQLLAVLALLAVLRRTTGVRFRALGGRGAGAVVGIVVACLGLYSIALALVSVGARWAVVLPALAALAVTTWLAGVAHRSATDRLRRA